MKYLKLLTAHKNIDTSIYNMKYSCVAKCLDVAEHNKTSMHYSTIATRFPLPNDYAEVEYIQTTSNKGRIVLDNFDLTDVGIGHSIRFKFKMVPAAAVNQTFLGFGSHGALTLNTSTSDAYDTTPGTYQYAFILWSSISNGSYTNLVNCSMYPAHWDAANFSIINHSLDYTHHYDIDLTIKNNNSSGSYTTTGYLMDIETGDKYLNYDASPYTKTSTFLFSQPYKMCIFNAVMYNTTYPQYYGWLCNNSARSNGHNVAQGLSFGYTGKKFYSRGKIFLDDTLYMFLYTCYNKTTHQYGLYDAKNNVFYGDFHEELDNRFVNNTNYYWDSIATATGETISAKEKTFLNICGPDDE